MAESLKAEVEAIKEQIQQELEAKASGSSRESWWKSGDAQPQKVPEVVRILKGHFGKVYSVHWAGDSKHIVSASQDGKLIVWNGMTTNKVQAIPLKSSWVMTCAYEQSENDMVACGGLDNICSVYQLGTEGGLSVTKAHRELAAHEGYLSCCRFNGPNQIISSSGDGTCIQWDIETGASIQTFSDHEGDVMSVAISKKDPHVFASASTDFTSRIFDTRMERCAWTFTGHESDVNSVSFFPSGTAIGTGSDDSTCKLFDLRACREINSYRSDSIVCGVTSVDFSISGKLLFAGYDDFNCFAWDTTSTDGRPLQLRVHENRVSCLQTSPSGDALGTGSWDTLVKVSA